MGLNIENINNAMDKKYTLFSDAIKNELRIKLSNHSDIVSYSNEFDKIQHMKNLFAKINSNSTEE